MPNKQIDTRKKFNFLVEIEGLNQFEVQDLVMPKAEIEQDTHSAGNHDIKTAGRISVGDIEIAKLRSANSSDSWAWEWLKQAQSFKDGHGLPPSQYKRTIVIRELAGDKKTTLNQWICYGAWCRSFDIDSLKRTESGNTMENVVLSIDSFEVL